MEGVTVIQKQVVVERPSQTVTVQNMARSVEVTQTPFSTVTVLKQSKSVTVNPGAAISVLQKKLTVEVTTLQSITVLRSRPFYFVATEGQAAFTLPTTPRPNGIIMLARNGTWQSQAKGDFSINGRFVTMDAGQDAGDEIAGIYEEL